MEFEFCGYECFVLAMFVYRASLDILGNQISDPFSLHNYLLSLYFIPVSIYTGNGSSHTEHSYFSPSLTKLLLDSYSHSCMQEFEQRVSAHTTASNTRAHTLTDTHTRTHHVVHVVCITPCTAVVL